MTQLAIYVADFDVASMNAPIGTFSLGPVARDGSGIERRLAIPVATSGAYRPVLVGGDGNQEPVRFEWIEIEIEMRTIAAPGYSIGRLWQETRNGMGYPAMETGQLSESRWIWELTPADAETVAEARCANPTGPYYFHVGVRGLVRVIGLNSGVMVRVCRAAAAIPQQYRIAESDWSDLIRELGFAVPASTVSLAGRATRERPEWKAAERRLEQARDHLMSGEDGAAVTACLREMEAFVTRPYDISRWSSALSAMPAQKEEAIGRLFSGAATWYNRVGAHRTTERGVSGDHEVVPLDHWEAELALAIAQILLAYAERLRTLGQLPVSPPRDPVDVTPTPAELPVIDGSPTAAEASTAATAPRSTHREL